MVTHHRLANCSLRHSVRCAILCPFFQFIYLGGFRFIVTLGWIMGKHLTLLFDPLESIVMFLSGVSQLQIKGQSTNKNSYHRKLCRAGWQVKLVGRHDSYV